MLVFHYADQKGLPLLDLSDLRALLTFLDSDAGKAELEGIGGLSSQTVGVLLRSLVGLETAAATSSSATRSSTSHDLLRTPTTAAASSRASSCRRVQDKPKLFSTALMWLLAELFEELPEAGDLDKPKLVLLLRRGAPAVRRREQGVPRVGRADRAADPLEGRRRLLRHPDAEGRRRRRARAARQPRPARAAGVHAGRREGARGDGATFPKSEFYDIEQLLQQLGIGEAAVTILSENGVPTPVVHTRLRPPRVAHGRRPTTSTRPRRPRRSTRSTARASTRRARASCSRRGCEAAAAAPAPEAAARDEPRAQEGGRGDGRRRRRHRRLPQLERGQAGRSARSCAASSGC